MDASVDLAPCRLLRPALVVEDLTLRYLTRRGEVKAVDGVSFTLAPGQALGLVGESGCGKTSVAMSLMKLLPDNARLIRGRVLLGEHDLLTMTEGELRRFRWRRISMVFQAAMNSLDPVYRVGEQIVEAIENHNCEDSRQQARSRVSRLFGLVGLEPQMVDRYPHELSGGMRQRVAIAMALACEPDVIIADEITTALDVIVQDRILRELRLIQNDLQMSMVYITHDMAVVAEVTDRLGVMYAGKLVEMGDTSEVFGQPLHPYTEALLRSFPSIRGEKLPLIGLPGEPPDLIQTPPGCRFHPRCPSATEICRQKVPPKVQIGTHWADCWHPLAVTATGGRVPGDQIHGAN
ncbi:MAG TPA: ABC transporter ATP-binding protein [Dehalococcoidia bacterium]|nr:ABC transporter ATP-binding protein [Dehalococcoidia bacterium]